MASFCCGVFSWGKVVACWLEIPDAQIFETRHLSSGVILLGNILGDGHAAPRIAMSPEVVLPDSHIPGLPNTAALAVQRIRETCMLAVRGGGTGYLRPSTVSARRIRFVPGGDGSPQSGDSEEI